MLFVCVENAGRSQMAEAFARQLGAGVLTAESAGSRPLGSIHPVVVQAMREKGLELAGHHSKGLDGVDSGRFDLVVTLCEEECPLLPGQARLHWPLPNPSGRGLEAVRPIRDAIEEHVTQLVEQLRG